MKKRIYVLIACEESQAECKAFRGLGFNAFSCDIQSCIKSGNPDWHIKGDVTPFLQGKTNFTTQSGLHKKVPRWDLIIAHPPCTYLCKVSSVWLRKDADYEIIFDGKRSFVNKERWEKLIQARTFFYECLHATAQYVAVENPLPMRLTGLPKPDMYACPSWFGFKYTKKTCYWLKNLPGLMAEYINPTQKSFVQCSRGKYRSRTYIGLANAIAKQWGKYILDELSK